MPAINVAKSDTFEIQRQKINEIGGILSQISAGGSDLQTGNLKLGDGTKLAPSLAFSSDPSLGLFKPSLKAMGLASGTKRIIDFRETEVVSFKDIIVQNKTLSSAGISITNVGLNYDVGSYTGVALIGGTGLGGTADINVTEFLGTITSAGAGYNPGSFGAFATGGNGSGAEINFGVDPVDGNISNAGSGYKFGTYTGVSLTNVSSSGNGATADIDVLGTQTISGTLTSGGAGYPGADGTYSVSLTGGTGVVNPIQADLELLGGAVQSVAITDTGEGYAAGDVLGVLDADLSGDAATPAGSGFAYTINSITYDGTIDTINIISSGQGYVIGDVLSANDSDLGGGGGGGFEFTISTQPGIPNNVEFSNKGTGYQVGDVLGLPGPLTNISTNTNASTAATGDVTTGSTTISNVSTAGIVVGMQVGSDTGEFDEASVVSSIGSGQIIISQPALGTATGLTITFTSPDPGDTFIVPTATAEQISLGSIITKVSGSGALASQLPPPGVTVTAVDTTTGVVTMNAPADSAGSIVLNITPAYGVPTQDLEFTISSLGSILDISINDGGSGYDVGDVLIVSPTDLTQPIVHVVDLVSVDVITPINLPAGTFSAGDTIDFAGGEGSSTPALLYRSVESGGNTVALIVEGIGADNTLTMSVGGGTSYSILSAATEERYTIDGVVGEDLTLYVNNVYQFDISAASLASNLFALSAFPGGAYGRGLVENITSNVSTSTQQVTVSDSSAIIAGMEVTVVSGNAQLQAGTLVQSVDNSTTITIDRPAAVAGSAVLTFTGTEYTDNVIRTATDLTIKVTSTTPNLYYYSQANPNLGGTQSYEGLFTINQNNPKTFGSEAEFLAFDIASDNVIASDVETGILTVKSAVGEGLTFDLGTVTDLTSTTSKTTDTHIVGKLASDPDGDDIVEISAGVSTDFTYGNVNIGSTIQIENANGNITSSGTIKSLLRFNSNDKMEIVDNTISTVPGQDLIFQPASANQTRILGTTALVIPAGTTADRPLLSVSYDGAIRYNTETNQYEGYNSSTTSWSSLGGIRDLDGNTTILAEETIGANDNTLWFIQDNVNTVRFTPEYQEFVNVKKVRSPNVSAPDYDEWRANVPVELGDYLKYRNNIYEVTSVTNVGGLNYTAASGSEPVHTTGALQNGDVELTWFTSAVSSLTFEEIDELRIDPLGFTALIVSNELRFNQNTISSLTSDILIAPNAGQKIKIDTTTSLVVPVGDSNSKGNPEQGSIRYNTTDSQFEGYNGAQWGGLGGVKDIDQDTLIKAETLPGQDEDTLFFINANNETVRITTTGLEFDTIDTITSVTSDTLNVNAGLITFDTFGTTLDNTDNSISFLHTSKDNFDFGLSTGLTVDPLIRMDGEGDIYYNLGFGTGTFSGVKLLDTDLQNFELAHYKVSTSRTQLVRGSINQNEAVVYDPTVETASELQIVAKNTTTGDKEFIKYSVVSKGTDIFHNEISNVRTGAQQISTLFDFNAFNEVRVTFILDAGLSAGNNVEVTVISHITK